MHTCFFIFYYDVQGKIGLKMENFENNPAFFSNRGMPCLEGLVLLYFNSWMGSSNMKNSMLHIYIMVNAWILGCKLNESNYAIRLFYIVDEAKRAMHQLTCIWICLWLFFSLELKYSSRISINVYRILIFCIPIVMHAWVLHSNCHSSLGISRMRKYFGTCLTFGWWPLGQLDKFFDRIELSII